jgi:hypothetical protein
VAVEEHHLPDLEVLGVVEGVAVEGFDQHLLLVVPEGEGVAAGYYRQPLLLWVDRHQSHALGEVRV